MLQGLYGKGHADVDKGAAEEEAMEVLSLARFLIRIVTVAASDTQFAERFKSLCGGAKALQGAKRWSRLQKVHP